MPEGALRRAAAEFVGTFALVFVAVGAGFAVAGTNEPRLVGVALAQGLILAVMVSAVGHISGGHFNPAVTLGFLVTRRIAPVLALIYWVVQFAAAVLAVLLLDGIFPDPLKESAGLGLPVLNVGITSFWAFVLEAVMTFFLVWVVFATAADPRGAFKSIAGLAIGLTLAADVLLGGPITGAAVNPARAFAPQVIENFWENAWVWYAGPLLGGALAALAYEYLYLRPLAPVPVGPPETGVDEPRPGDAATD